MIGQKKRLTASAARRKHSVTAAIFDCCTLICRIGEKLAVYPSQMPRVLDDVLKWCNLTFAFFAVHTVVNRYLTDIMAGKIQFCILSCHNIISAKTGKVFRNNTVDFSCFYIFNHSLETRSFKICSRPALGNILIDDIHMMVFRIKTQHTPLCGNAGTFTL